MKQVKALYDFEAVEEKELSLSAGEVLQVLDDTDPNWWRGMSDRGGIGYFRPSLVTEDIQPNNGTAISLEKTPLLKSTQIEYVPCSPLDDLGHMPSAPMYSATSPTTSMMFKHSPVKIYAPSPPMYSADPLGTMRFLMQSSREVDENVITKCLETLKECKPGLWKLQFYEQLCEEQSEIIEQKKDRIQSLARRVEIHENTLAMKRAQNVELNEKLDKLKVQMDHESEEFDQIENNLRTENFELKRQAVKYKFQLGLITKEDAIAELGCNVAELL
ncbi:SH3 domain-containing protein [Ditylenchus destructor]|nr:SH3 domain-containing protein [Ditylenchus destructor]